MGEKIEKMGEKIEKNGGKWEKFDFFPIFWTLKKFFSSRGFIGTPPKKFKMGEKNGKKGGRNRLILCYKITLCYHMAKKCPSRMKNFNFGEIWGEFLSILGKFLDFFSGVGGGDSKLTIILL